MQRCHVDISSRRQEEARSAQHCHRLFPGAFLPMQEDLIVLQHLVVTDVLEPAGSRPISSLGRAELELERKACKQAAFTATDRHGIDHREDAPNPSP
ncbi:MAG: hypothetical protein CM15mP77_0320 [Synechococcus sp.]|nr:MAG: hypothetical protein CM15mP77_0320 [Synechococcus sp.]